MSHREQILAILERRPPERIPWAPRLKIWYEANCALGRLPEKYAGCSLDEIEDDQGMATPARDGRVFTLEPCKVEVRVLEEPDGVRTLIHTPRGSLSTRTQRTEELARRGMIGLEVERLIKGSDDYPAVEYLIEHTEVVPTYEAYLEYEQQLGNRGVPIVPIGQDPMSHLLWDLIGADQAYYHLHDYPDLVAHLLGVLTEQALEIQRVAIQSPARLFLHGEHFDSYMTPPRLFEKYMMPYFQACTDRLHAAGKQLACHADADSSLLLDLIRQAGFDMAECFLTAPMARVTMEEARRAWGTQVIIWGGIPSVMLCDPVTDAEFEEFLLRLFRAIAPGVAFILGVADNVVAEARFDRIERIGQWVREFGKVPVQV